MAQQEAAELLIGQRGEQGFEALATTGIDALEECRRTGSRLDEDDPTVVRVVAALDQVAGFHPVDDARGARNADVERFREVAHRQRTFRLEEREDVQVGQAERALVPAPEGGHEFARVPGAQLVDDVALEPDPGLAPSGRGGIVTAGRGGGIVTGRIDIQRHADNLRQRRRDRNLLVGKDRRLR